MFSLLLVATLVVLFLVVVVVTRFPRRSRNHLVAGRTRGMTVYRPTTLDEAQLVSFWPVAAWQARVRQGLVADGGVVELFILRDVTFAAGRILCLFVEARVRARGHARRVALPSTLFLLRGPCVPVLLWYRDDQLSADDQLHAILVSQPRVATGGHVWEVPLGVVVDGHVVGPTVDLVRAQTKHELSVCDLVPHALSHPHTSSQLLDEELHVSTRQVQKGDVPAYGVTASGVGLRIRALPVRSPAARRDVKLLCRLDAVFGGGA